MKAQFGTVHTSVTPRLNWTAEAQRLATKRGRKLPTTELKAAVDAALALTPVVVAEAPPLPAGFETLMSH